MCSCLFPRLSPGIAVYHSHFFLTISLLFTDAVARINSLRNLPDVSCNTPRNLPDVSCTAPRSRPRSHGSDGSRDSRGSHGSHPGSHGSDGDCEMDNNSIMTPDQLIEEANSYLQVIFLVCHFHGLSLSRLVSCRVQYSQFPEQDFMTPALKVSIFWFYKQRYRVSYAEYACLMVESSEYGWENKICTAKKMNFLEHSILSGSQYEIWANLSSELK